MFKTEDYQIETFENILGKILGPENKFQEFNTFNGIHKYFFDKNLNILQKILLIILKPKSLNASNKMLNIGVKNKVFNPFTKAVRST